MFNYANGFSISVNDTKNEFLICCRQRTPVIDDNGSITGLEVIDVAKIAMNKEGFLALRQLIDSFSVD